MNIEYSNSAVAMRGITKCFPGVLANDGLDFTALPGEIHTLLGENGAGKSTLMQILSGLYQPDSGKIIIRGREVRLKTPRESIEAGIGMIYQHFMLVNKHTVTENIILGLRKFGWIIDYRKAAEKITTVSRNYGLELNPARLIWQLSVGEQQRVEIVKMLFRRVNILILDEPTAVLTPQESQDLFQTLCTLREEGKTIIFISHKLDEVMDISDRITILRQGRKVKTVFKKDTNQRELARLMVGRKIFFHVQRKPVATPEPVLTVREVKAVDDRRLPALRGVSFEVHQREILGLAGISGNGQKELEEVLSGLRKSTSGEIILGEKEIAGCSPEEIIREGLSYIPEDRLGVGLAGGLNYTLNIMLKNYRYSPLKWGPFIDYRKARSAARRLLKEFNIAVPDPSAPLRLLSGGNLQKVVLARELTSKPRFLLAVHPTRGLDIGASEYIRQTLEKMKCRGTAILLISEDLQEILSLSDRIAVIYEGKITEILNSEEASIEKLGLLMTGQKI